MRLHRHAALLLSCALSAGFLLSCGGGSTAETDSCPINSDSDIYSPNPPDTNGKTDKAQVIPEMAHTHVDPPTQIQYNHNPPTSGCHYNLGFGKSPITPGVYTQHVDAPYWVHNLEHGYIIVFYNCPSGCAADFQKLREWFAKQPVDPALQAVAQQQSGFTPYPKILVLPWSFDHKFAAVSWDYYDPMDSLDLTEIDAFVANHIDHGPEGVNTP